MTVDRAKWADLCSDERISTLDDLRVELNRAALRHQMENKMQRGSFKIAVDWVSESYWLLTTYWLLTNSGGLVSESY